MVIMVFVDVFIGYAFKEMRKMPKSGITHKNYYISEELRDDVIILGSSRAARHYDPAIIGDTLGLTCYNCGEPGCGIVTAYARFQMILQRHRPKLVIYEITPGYDYFVSDPYSKYLGALRRDAYKEPVKKVFKDFGDQLMPLRLLSSLYHANSCLVENLMDIVSPASDDLGYAPLVGTLPAGAAAVYQRKHSTEVDTLKLSYIQKLIDDAKNEHIAICFVSSPRYGIPSEEDVYDFQVVRDICAENHVPYLDYYYTEGISDNHRYFQDTNHLNIEGARVFSSLISRQVKNIIVNNGFYGERFILGV